MLLASHGLPVHYARWSRTSGRPGRGYMAGTVRRRRRSASAHSTLGDEMVERERGGLLVGEKRKWCGVSEESIRMGGALG